MNTTKLRNALVTIGALGILASGSAHADTQSVTVNAQIIGICKFNSGQTPVVTIANTGVTIDPSLAGPATGTAAILYRCTKSQAPVFTVPTPATVTCTTAGTCFATTMAPTLTSVNTGAGTGFSGANQTLTVTGTLTQAQYQDMQAGTYSGTVTVTVTP